MTSNICRFSILLLSVLLILSGCGGGGGGGGGGVSGTTVKGAVSQGIVANGSVTVYALNDDGSKGVLLATTDTDEAGLYEAALGLYTGPILVEASGDYLDEATGTVMTIPTSNPLRGVHTNATGTVWVAVTGLTELAVRKAEGGGLTAAAIAAANALISGLFGFDVVASQPVAPVSADLVLASEDAKNYTMALATLSQLAYDRGVTAETLLTDLSAELLANSRFSFATLDAFDGALAAFVVNPNNLTGVASANETGLEDVGRSRLLLRLSLSGLSVGETLGALQATVVLPDVTRVASIAPPAVDAGVVSASGVAATGMVTASYRPATGAFLADLTLGLLHVEGFGNGEVLTIACEYVGTLPAGSDFELTGIVSKDGFGVLVSGVTVSAQTTATP